MTKHADIAIDADGTILPMTPSAVHAHVRKMIDEGEILAVVIRNQAGEIGVQVFGPPSHELLHILQTATRGYRRALKSAKGH